MFDLRQPSFSQILKMDKFDLMIAALGNEHRASYLAKRTKDLNIKKKVCIKLVDDINLHEKKVFENLGFSFISLEEVEKLLSGYLNNVIIDYSVMMKSLYANLLMQISKNKYLDQSKIYFSYTKAEFEEPQTNYFPLDPIKPLLQNTNQLPTNNNDRSMILSLGYERISAIGVVENLEIDFENVLIFINKVSKDSLHYERNISINKDFLDLFNPSQIFELNFYNFPELITTLDSILESFSKENHQVILSPLSIKIFSFVSMILAFRHKNAFFYNVTSQTRGSVYQKKPIEGVDPYVYELSKLDIS